MNQLAEDDLPRCSLEETWFDDFLPVERNDVAVEDMLGLDSASDATLVNLCGAPKDATVEMYSDGQSLIFEVTQVELVATRNRISVSVDENRQLYLTLNLIDLADDAPAGLGLAMLCRMVRACRRLNIDKIYGYAVGGRLSASKPNGERLLGYYAWPRFGFDGPFGEIDADTALFQHYPCFPAGVGDGSVSTLLSLFGKKGGPQYWLINGTNRHVCFDVARGSPSMLVLAQYLSDKGQSL